MKGICVWFREIDFVKETVRTLAGNGTKGADYRGGKKGSAQVHLTPTACDFQLRFLHLNGKM